MTTEAVRKRQRTSSGGVTLSSKTVGDNLHRYGELILHCSVNITRSIRECGNGLVLKYVCALLNSGGGILHMRNMDLERGPVLSKHLDTWWSGMECKMADIISRDDICNYFDLVGNHDEPDLFLFVKTAEHLCTLDFNCRLPTDTATHDVTYQSVMKLITANDEPGTLEDLPPIPTTFIYGRSAERTKKETKQIQFKQLTSSHQRGGGKGLPGKIQSLMLKYISAFANHEGGHIYFGIDDVRASVIGEDLNESEQRRTEDLVKSRMLSVIWGDERMPAVRGKHWDIQFYPVENAPRKQSKVVVVVSVCKFPGGVFTSCPESCYVNRDSQVVDFTFSLWKNTMLNPLRDVPELHSRFIKMPMNVPNAPLVFTLPRTMQDIKQKSLLGKKEVIFPRHFIEKHATVGYKAEISHIVQMFARGAGLCIGLGCWGLKIPLQCPDVLCDLLVLTEEDGVHVLTVALQNKPRVRRHAQTVATVLKNKMVIHGGLRCKFGIVSHVIDVTQFQEISEAESNLFNRDLYPSHFSISGKFDGLIDSLIICMSSYTAHPLKSWANNIQGNYKFLLTHDQFDLLWTQQFTKELWVHGPPGAGKTLAAIQLIQELRRRGCSFNNILYLAENEKLCDFVRDHRLCIVSTRRNLFQDASNEELMGQKYSTICNVIVDEAQNFKDRDGDWYHLAEKLAQQQASEHLKQCCNYFWVFMDYSQKVHKFKAGLPSIIGKNNFMLSEVSRSTKEIFQFTSRLMMASDNVEGLCNPYLRQMCSVPKLAHNYSAGKGVDILSCDESQIHGLLGKVMSGLLSNGVKENDIAILVGRRSELNKLQTSFMDHQTENNENESNEANTIQKTYKLLDNNSAADHNLTDTRFSSSDNLPEYENIPIKETDVNECLVPSKSPSSPEDSNLEVSNPFGVLASSNDFEELESEEEVDSEDDVVKESSKLKLKSTNIDAAIQFYGEDSENEENYSDIVHKDKQFVSGQELKSEVQMVPRQEEKGTVHIDTVRGFSGLDKAAVIGINPEVNEDHADFNRFLLSLASRARDNLVIITTTDSIKEQLAKYAST